MEVDQHESLVLHAIELLELLCCHADEKVEHVQEELVRGSHDLLVGMCLVECYLSISCPY